MDCLIGVPLAIGTAWCCCVHACPEGTIPSSSTKRVYPFNSLYEDDERPRKMTTEEIEIYNAHMNLYGNTK